MVKVVKVVGSHGVEAEGQGGPSCGVGQLVDQSGQAGVLQMALWVLEYKIRDHFYIPNTSITSQDSI